MTDIIATDKPKVLIKRASIEIDGRCNYRCTCCPQSYEGGREKEFLVQYDFNKFVSLLDQMEGLEVVNLEGSGEPTLNKELPRYIAELTRRGVKSMIYTNGLKFKGYFMEECFDSGLSYARFSILGYNPETYHKIMGKDKWYKVLDNMQAAVEYSYGNVGVYHLLQGDSEYEMKMYKRIALGFNVLSEVWKYHNWAGTYETVRQGKRRTCGRPSSPSLTVRANNTVVPCSNVLGVDSTAVMGSLDESSLYEISNGDKYNELRDAHTSGNYDTISYCKNCDFLYDDNEVLVWTNSDDVMLNRMKGVSFKLR